MTKVAAAVTTSLDGYITGPNDGPGRGLGEGGERLHYWVFKRLFDGFEQTLTPSTCACSSRRSPPTSPTGWCTDRLCARPGFELACHGICTSGVGQLELTPRRPNDHSPVRRFPRRIPRRGWLEEAA
jgi:hypothetical protein